MLNQILPIILLLLIFNTGAVAQEESKKVDRDWIIETEPTTFFLSGYYLMLGRNLTADNKLSLSAFAMALDVPDELKTRIFNNTTNEHELRLGLQIALNLRYKIEIFKEKESNPYIGFIGGWEYFTLSHNALPDLRTDVYVLTPYVGHLIYFYKQMLYVNPQLRGVFYVNPVYDQSDRMEELNDFIILPQISLGIRL